MLFNYHNFVYLFHIIFIGPLIAYLGYASLKGNKINIKTLRFIVFLGISTVFYHGYLLYSRIKLLNY